MRRNIHSRGKGEVTAPIALGTVPPDVALSLDAGINRGVVRACVKEGQRVNAWQAVARGEHTVVHTPFAGVVRRADEVCVELECDASADDPPASPVHLKSKEDLADFALEMGLAGMGGGLFPYARRLKRGVDMPLHTLVINAVECEPGIQIDEALLVHDGAIICEAVHVIASLLGLGRVVLGVRSSARARIEAAMPEPFFEVIEMSDRYPAGAGKLLVGKLAGRVPAAGTLNTDLGYWVMNVASLWAFGRRLRYGRPSVERPLTLLAPHARPNNLIAPLGVRFSFLLQEAGVRYDPAVEVLVAEGRMMGRAVSPEERVGKGTLALMVLPREERWLRAEQPCILCGSCFDVCPLKLHPIGMADRVRQRRDSRALRAQLRECFLCGACSAVCPADIPLVQVFREGKQWMKKNGS